MPDAATEAFICCDKLSCTEASDGLAKAISLAITLALLERQALSCTGVITTECYWKQQFTMPGICVTNNKRSRFVLFAQISTPQSGCASPVPGSLHLAYCLALFQGEGGGCEGGGGGGLWGPGAHTGTLHTD